MPWFVNNQLVPEESIRKENARISREPQWQSIADLGERSQRMRQASEQAAIDRVLVEQHAIRDTRPIAKELMDREISRVREGWGGSGAFDDSGMRSWVERQLRVQRTQREIAEPPIPISPEDVEAFYHTNRDKLSRVEMFRAAHIVKYIDRERSEEQARLRITEALAELERGVAFGDVAASYSDCNATGGDLGYFPAGKMVEEFETELRALQVGQRSGIFRTPFGLHIAELRDRQPAGTAELEEIRSEIERVLTFARRHEAYERSIAQMRSGAEIRYAEAMHASSRG